jgi:hypothetical protein
MIAEHNSPCFFFNISTQFTRQALIRIDRICHVKRFAPTAPFFAAIFSCPTHRTKEDQHGGLSRAFRHPTRCPLLSGTGSAPAITGPLIALAVIVVLIAGVFFLSSGTSDVDINADPAAPLATETVPAAPAEPAAQ